MNVSYSIMSTVAAEVTPEIEPETEPETEPEVVPETFAEPVPEWPEALAVWKISWPLHIYITASVFALISLFAIVNLIVLLKSAKLRKLHTRWYFFNLNLLLFFTGLLRSLYFFFDPYNFRGILPRAVSFIFMNLPFPCITSAYIIILVTFIHITRMRSINPRLLRPRTILLIIFLIFAITIAADVTTGLMMEAKLVGLLCSLSFTVWGLVLAGGYAYIVLKLYRSWLLHRRLTRQGSAHTSFLPKEDAGSSYKITRKPQLQATSRTQRSVQVMAVVVVVFLLWTSLNLYGAIGVYRLVETPSPWPWYGLQTGLRACEVLLGLMVLYMSSQPTMSVVRKDQLEGDMSQDTRKMHMTSPTSNAPLIKNTLETSLEESV